MENNDFSIVLGYPYWNATYWLVSAENWRNVPLKSQYDGGHGYYENLYRFNNINVLDEVASLMLLYNEVYISPADCPLPDYSTHTKDNVYSNHKLGFYSSWDWMNKSRDEDEKLCEQILQNLNPSFLPNFSKEQLNNIKIILIDIITQIRLAIEFNSSLLIGKEFEYLYKFTASFLDLNPIQDKIDNASIINKSLQTIQTTTGFLFNLNSFSEFEELRKNQTIREYATAMRRNLSKAEITEHDELLLLETMMNAINTSDISSKIGTGLNATSKLLSIASLVPGIGTITGVGSLMTDYINQKRDDASPKWWSLFPEINNALTKYRIETRYKELKKNGSA